MTSRFRDIESSAETNFSHQHRGFLSEITPTPASKAQRHSLGQVDTAEMMRRDTRNREVELRQYHRRGEGQPKEFQHSQADLQNGTSKYRRHTQ